MERLFIYGGGRKEPIAGHTGFRLPLWHYNESITYVEFDDIQNFVIAPNPTSAATGIHYAVPERSEVYVALYPARLPSETKEEVLKRFSGSTLFNMRNGVVHVLVDHEIQEAGSYSVQVDARELELKTGFYQYVLKAGGYELKRNFYFARSCEEALPELREFFYVCRRNSQD